VGTRSFPGLKRSRRGVDHPPPSSAKVKERVELYLHSPSELFWPVTFAFNSRFLQFCERA